MKPIDENLKKTFLDFNNFSVTLLSNEPIPVPRKFSSFTRVNAAPKNCSVRVIFSPKLKVAVLSNTKPLTILLPQIPPPQRLMVAYYFASVEIIRFAASLSCQIIHAAGIAFGDKCSLFIGESGAGKTTISRGLKKSFNVLCDETIMLQYSQGESIGVSFPPLTLLGPQYSIYPKKINIFNHGAFPIDKLFFIKKSNRNKKQIIPENFAYSLLFNSLIGWDVSLKKIWTKRLLNSAQYFLLEHYTDNLNDFLGEVIT